MQKIKNIVLEMLDGSASTTCTKLAFYLFTLVVALCAKTLECTVSQGEKCHVCWQCTSNGQHHCKVPKLYSKLCTRDAVYKKLNIRAHFGCGVSYTCNKDC
uniref:Uncharacterized protein n=1 Tax=Eutreptiella gymnastica TaxID=73025 RepID=A0A6U8MHD4_9EUGL|mmetsp:Transcript_83803/g.147568  ORF Transcript_83803/g.147568 Transcript_83803/m.147568 type:complete len:101 (+) Transcript_83803:464-766(+)